MTRGLTAATTALAAGAAVGPWSAMPLAPLMLLGILAALGSWKLWHLHALLQTPDGGEGLTAQQRRQLEDDCELATFAALQEAAQLVAVARDLVAGRSGVSPLIARCEDLEADLEAFVFTGDGLGDLAAAWALEDATRALAEEAASHRWRPAA